MTMDYDKAAQFWLKKDRESAGCPDAVERLDAFLTEHHVCALATASGGFVRCTPLEYTYLEHAFWFFSEGGLKFRALKENKHVCIAVFDSDPSFGGLHSAQITGTAEMVELFSEEYEKLLACRHIPEAVIRKMEEPMHLIKVIPEEADYLDSGLKQEGYGSRQHIVF